MARRRRTEREDQESLEEAVRAPIPVTPPRAMTRSLSEEPRASDRLALTPAIEAGARGDGQRLSAVVEGPQATVMRRLQGNLVDPLPRGAPRAITPLALGTRLHHRRKLQWALQYWQRVSGVLHNRRKCGLGLLYLHQNNAEPWRSYRDERLSCIGRLQARFTEVQLRQQRPALFFRQRVRGFFMFGKWRRWHRGSESTKRC